MATRTSVLNYAYDVTSLKAMAQSGIGAALSAFGWTAQSGNGEVNWANVVAVQPSSNSNLPPRPTTYRYQGNFVPGTSYTGNTADSQTNDLVNGSDNNTYMCALSTQLVLTAVTTVNAGVSVVYTGTITSGASNAYVGKTFTIAGFVNAHNNGTYVCSASTTTTITLLNTDASATTVTAAGTCTQYDQPSTSLWNGGTNGGMWYLYPYETWKNASTTNPIYIKVVYSYSTASGVPIFQVSLGNNYSTLGTSAGTITGNQMTWGTNNIQLFGGTASNSRAYECCFSGDSYNFRCTMWSSGDSDGAQIPWTLVVDYARDPSGAVLDTYFMVCSVSGNSGLGSTVAKQFIYKSGAGGVSTLVTARWASMMTDNSTQTASSGSIAALPIQNTMGYIANPQLGAVIFKLAEVGHRQLVNVYLLGTMHTYLVHRSTGSGNSITNVLDPALNAASSATNQGAAGILWE